MKCSQAINESGFLAETAERMQRRGPAYAKRFGRAGAERQRHILRVLCVRKAGNMKAPIIILIALFAATSALGQTEIAPEKIGDPITYIKQETIGGKRDFNQVLDREKKALYV